MVYNWSKIFARLCRTRVCPSIAAFRRGADEHFDVIIDYLWGRTAEALLEAITEKNLPLGNRRPDCWRWARPLDLQSLCPSSPAKHGADDSRNRRLAVLGHTHRGIPTGNESRGERQVTHRDRCGLHSPRSRLPENATYNLAGWWWSVACQKETVFSFSWSGHAQKAILITSSKAGLPKLR